MAVIDLTRRMRGSVHDSMEMDVRLSSRLESHVTKQLYFYLWKALWRGKALEKVDFERP